MQLFHSGAPIAELPYGTYGDISWQPLLADTPPFTVDAVLVTEVVPEAEAQLATLRRYGRPAANLNGQFSPTTLSIIAADLAEAPRTNYTPIACNFYDNFEIAIMRGTQVQLQYKGAREESVERNVRLLATRTSQTEEFVQLEDGSWLRMDQVEAVDGVPAGASCRF